LRGVSTVDVAQQPVFALSRREDAVKVMRILHATGFAIPVCPPALWLRHEKRILNLSIEHDKAPHVVVTEISRVYVDVQAAV